MSTQVARPARMEHPNPNPLDYTTLSEEEILADVREFTARLTELDGSSGPVDQTRRQVYVILLQHRQQLLAALRDGNPDNWPEYPPVPEPAG